MNLYMTALSNIHTPSSTHTRRLTQSGQTCRQVDGTRRGRMLLGGGWVANIDSMSTVLGERRGQRRFPYKANSGPISSHILSGDPWFFFFFLYPPPFLFLPLCVAFVLPFIFILLKAKEREKKKTRSTKVVLPAVNRGNRVGVEGGYR